jgi:pyruvate-ferredoxin/flavodoxin oxidoreductase
MGSGAETAHDAVEYMVGRGEKVGIVKVRLYRPFAGEQFLAALPATVKTLTVLDRTKEPGSAGEPLYQDVVTAVSEGMAAGIAPFSELPKIVGGRYGLSSKEFTPAMVDGIFAEAGKVQPKNHFTVGIHDDVTHTSLEYDPFLDIEPEDVVRAVFWGLGSDGTVGANKNSIKIIGSSTDNYAQGYFVYDSKKSGARTISHLRFGPKPIRSTCLIRSANFVAVHQFGFMKRYNVLESAIPGATFLLNSPYGPEEVWGQLPRPVQEQIIEKQLKFYVIDAYEVARDLGLGGRINTIMQACFFAISGVLPRDQAIDKIKEAIKKTYGKRGDLIVRQNFDAVDAAQANLYEVPVSTQADSTIVIPPVVSPLAPEFVQNVTAKMMAGEGDLLPVSALPVDGTYPSATTQWEKRNIAQEVPIWDPDVCIQCGKCVMVCPHAVIRSKILDDEQVAQAPDGFMVADARWRELPDKKYTLQVAVEDCTGCQLCVEVCPAKNKRSVGRKAINMAPHLEVDSLESGRENWAFFSSLPETPQDNGLRFNNVKNVQLLEPLFEFSGACAGCGETPYLKLLSQLFGDRTIIANATGCSSIYGGNLPTTPWAVNSKGRGPAWSNSLFEDNAEFGLGMRVTLDTQVVYASELVGHLRDQIGPELADELLAAEQVDNAQIEAQRIRVEALKDRLSTLESGPARDLLSLADKLVKKTVWIVGGDGWAYDIGYGGLDHVLASGRNVNVLVLDTEVYSNTGGQASKATPLGAVAKFAAGGKPTPKKDLGLMAMSYGSIYVASVAMGANDRQTLNAFIEAESYDGPSLIIAYSHCIAHGINMAKGMDQQKMAVDSGYWPLYRFDPRQKEADKNALHLDSKAPRIPLREYAYNENRYRMLLQTDPEGAERLMVNAQQAVWDRWHRYEELAKQEV